MSAIADVTDWLRSARGSARYWRRDPRGAAVVEFALIAPVAFLLLAIIVVLGQGMEILGKASLTARTVTSLVTTQGSSITQSNLNCILNAAGAVMSPWDTGPLSMVVTEINVTSSTTGVVVWSSASYQGTARAVGSTVALKSGAFLVGSYQILGEVSYVYTPLGFPNASMASQTLTQTIFMAPRSNAAITLTTS